MKDKKELELSPSEMIRLAKRVNNWTRTREGEGEDGLKTNRYIGCYFGVHLDLSRIYDPAPYEGYGTHISLTASLDKIKLGLCRYDYQETEGTVDYDRGVKELENIVSSINKSLSRKGINKKGALAYARRLILEEKKPRAK